MHCNHCAELGHSGVAGGHGGSSAAPLLGHNASMNMQCGIGRVICIAITVLALGHSSASGGHGSGSAAPLLGCGVSINLQCGTGCEMCPAITLLSLGHPAASCEHGGGSAVPLSGHSTSSNLPYHNDFFLTHVRGGVRFAPTMRSLGHHGATGGHKGYEGTCHYAVAQCNVVRLNMGLCGEERLGVTQYSVTNVMQSHSPT